ncbi:MAG: serine hydrolase domain-containing protein [Gammaproteobacteria bacterium]
MNAFDQSSSEIHGRVEPGFERVREAFAANFRRRDDYTENGAALAVSVAGRTVVDLWGGFADRARARAWQPDTLINVYSTSKGVTAAALAMLVDAGQLRYDDPVVKYWPEYGAAGKERTTVAQLLSHQAGLSGFAEPTPPESIYDWHARCASLARQAPLWEPGTKTSYHAMTWGFLAGELFRRASGGITVGRWIAERIARPLGADIFIGLPQSQEHRVAEMQAPRTPPDLSALTQPPEALAALVNPRLDAEACNARAWRAAELPSVNGQASARGLARLYGAVANGGTVDGVTLLSPDAIRRMAQIQRGRTDLLLGFTDNWGMGVCFNQFSMLGPSPDTFGHGGWGGSIGCADVAAKVGIGYVCNQMGAQLVGDPRQTALCGVIFECL